MSITYLANYLSLRRRGISDYHINQSEIKPNIGLGFGNHNHMACLFIGTQVISSGMNYQINDTSTIHAEQNAISKLPRRSSRKLKRVNLLVVRTSKSGKLNNSRPCLHCIKSMMSKTPLYGYKIHYVYFSTDDGSIQKIKLSELNLCKENHISSFYRRRLRKQIKIG
jgi:cytidine deaminase